jgi:hypothetical protein
MKKILVSFIVAMAFGCSAQVDEPIASEKLALPVTASAPCIEVRCDQVNCSGLLTVTQTIPAITGNVELWDATQWVNGPAINWTYDTTIAQSPGSVVTTTRLPNFRQNETFSLVTGVVTRNAAGNIVGSAPVVNGELSLRPTSVTATVSP